MKRLLCSHHRAQRRLEQYGVDSRDEAVSPIAGLILMVEQMRTQQHPRERETLQDANDRLRNETERLRRTVEHQQRRIERLEEGATQPPHLSTPDS